MKVAPETVLRAYLLVVGVGLLAQGGLSLVLRAAGALAPDDTNGLVTGDARHATIHVVWGVALLAFLVSRPNDRGVAFAGLAFGIFYTAFAFAGIVVHHPFGLALDSRQNGFHTIVGPIALVLAGLAWPRGAREWTPQVSRR
jgi:hypothetical protein